MLFIGKSLCGGALPGLNSVEHSPKESAPGAFAPFVGGVDHIQTWLKGEGLPLQLAEGSGHGKNFHGRTTSCPSKIWREIRAAK